MRDIVLVAHFELLRALRTWRAVALIVLFAVASGGSTYLFTRMVGFLENQMADQLAVPRTQTPGAMLDELLTSDSWREIVQGMVGAPELVDLLLEVPPLAMFNLWFGFLLVPFFAASASAECIAIDVQSRAIRYEVLRTGRLEMVLGRWLGQTAVTLTALLASVGAAFGVGLGFMVIADPIGLLGWLLWFSLRSAAFALPFIGVGIAASQLTASPAWARVIAVGATALTWVGYGLARRWESEPGLQWVSDLLLQVLPQGWLQGLWTPGAQWLTAAVALLGLALVFAAIGYLRFARRDL